MENDYGTIVAISKPHVTIMVPHGAAVSHNVLEYQQDQFLDPVQQRVLAFRFPDGHTRMIQDGEGRYVREGFAGNVWCPEEERYVRVGGG